eukprot:6140093-Prymnesium_polylepis.1
MRPAHRDKGSLTLLTGGRGRARRGGLNERDAVVSRTVSGGRDVSGRRGAHLLCWPPRSFAAARRLNRWRAEVPPSRLLLLFFLLRVARDEGVVGRARRDQTGQCRRRAAALAARGTVVRVRDGLV